MTFFTLTGKSYSFKKLFNQIKNNNKKNSMFSILQYSLKDCV